MAITRTAYTAFITQAAVTADLDPILLEALILVESSGHADAFRFEPQFAARYKIATHTIYKRWPVRAVASSYGLCQIMCPTAYEQGWRGDTPEELFIPTTNLRWGATYLAACFRWARAFKAPEADTLRGALCAYNMGRNSQTSPLNPRPSNVAYAQKVLTQAKALAGFLQASR